MASSITLLYDRKDPPVIGELTLDASLTEVHDLKSDVSAFPVEDGSVMTDHIRNTPDRVTIEGFVTNSPVQDYGQPFQPDQFRGTTDNRTELAYTALRKIHTDRQPVDIFTNLREYESMAMESLSIPRNASIGDAIQFSATFVKVVKVPTSLVQVENLASGTNGVTDKASSEVKGGRKPTGKPTEAQVDNGTALYKAGLKIGEFFGGGG